MARRTDLPVPTVPPDVPTASVAPPLPDVSHAPLDDEFELALQAAGVTRDQVDVPDVDFYLPTTLDELCTITWEKLPKAKVSPLMIVKRAPEFPEAEKFEGYKGFVRFEVVLASQERLAWSTHLWNKTTGELGPVAEYARERRVPFAIRVGSFETSTQGRHVYRPVSLQEP